MSYEDIDLNIRLRRIDSPAGRPREYTTALDEDLAVEKTPYINTIISKGTMQTLAGGLPQFKSTSGTSGGTTIMDVDPDTGTVTIRGGLVAQQTLDLGTINNTKIAGTPELIGTFTNSRLINNGTWNNGTLGTPAITGGTVTSSVLNANTVGSPSITSGTFTTSVINNSTIGTPAVTGGTINPSVYQAGGTAEVSGSIVYVKTVDFAGSTTTLGTTRFKGIIYSNA